MEGALNKEMGILKHSASEAQGIENGTDSFFCKLLMKRILFGNAEKSK